MNFIKFLGLFLLINVVFGVPVDSEIKSIQKRQIGNFLQQSLQQTLTLIQQQVTIQTQSIVAELTQQVLNSIFNPKQKTQQQFMTDFLNLLQKKLAESTASIVDAKVKYNTQKLINDQIDKLKAQLTTNPNIFTTGLKDLLITFQSTLTPVVNNVADLLKSTVYQFMTAVNLSSLLNIG